MKREKNGDHPVVVNESPVQLNPAGQGSHFPVSKTGYVPVSQSLFSFINQSFQLIHVSPSEEC